jgi:mannose-6-phosphate isomerase-like protein (cupin superfamily)
VLNNIKATAATVGEEAMTTSDTTTTPGRSMTWPDGTVFRITRSSEDTDGAYLEMEWDLPAHGWAPGAHVHPGLTEAYEILDGSLDVQINGVWKTLQQGESAVVPRGALHTFRVGNAPAKVRNVHKPALDFEPYIRTLNATFNERGLGKGKGVRALLYTVLVLRRYPESSKAPNALLQGALPALAAVARVLRMRPASAR